MITGVQPKILLEMDADGNIKINDAQAELLGLTENTPNWMLVREHDELTHRSKDVTWLEWDENGKFKARHSEPAIGRSLLMSPFNAFYTWQTTDITELVEYRDDYVKFKTRNSTYELSKINKTQ